MGWEAESRALLSSMRKDGAVVVRYQVDGCNVELELLDCAAEGSYDFTPHPRTETKFARNQGELFAELPVGAANLAGNVSDDQALRTDYMLAGIARLPPVRVYRPSDLKGVDCQRATHVVSRVFLGGFAMVSGSESTLEASASFFDAGGGAKHSSSVKTIAREGDPAQCQAALQNGSQQPLCNIPLRVGLRAIEGVGEAICPAGTELNDDAQCVTTAVGCPAGTQWDGQHCKGKVETSCPEGHTYQAELGCVAKVVRTQPRPRTASTGRGPRLVLVPAGTFEMGSLEGGPDERLSTGRLGTYEMEKFWLDQTEVSVSHYASCVSDGACDAPATGVGCTWGSGSYGDYPINCLTVNDAHKFCRWAGKRLPTEYEWEFATRGKRSYLYAWGGETPTDQLCWSGFKGKRAAPCKVASYQQSEGGHYDLAGNVWEWTSSRYCGSADINCNRCTAPIYTQRVGVC